MNEDLRAVAERFRTNSYNSVDHAEMYEQPLQRARDAMTLADAYLLEHPLDDDELVTPDTMWEFGFGDSASLRNEKRFEICSGIRVMFFACDGPKCWKASIWFGNRTKDTPTRGDVRRLCKALGIELK